MNDMSDYEELQEKRKATINVPSINGEYRTEIESIAKDGTPYFDGFNSYMHAGHIWYLDNPKVGKYVRMPRGGKYKVIGIETGRRNRFDKDPAYVKVVLMRRINE